MRDSDSNRRAFRRRIEHIEEASADTQVAGSALKPGIRRRFGHFGICNELIPRSTAAFGVHMCCLLLVTGYRGRQQGWPILGRAQRQVNRVWESQFSKAGRSCFPMKMSCL